MTGLNDWVVIGSGFGGSVAALRLAEKGYSVTVLEQGRRYRDEDFARNAWQVGKLLWAPKAGLRGIMRITPFRHVSVLSGVGVGGGSLVYGNTLYVPHSDDFYRHEQWAHLADWRAELAPHYTTAGRMLGVTTFAGTGASERMMQAIATDLGAGASVQPAEVGVFFGAPGETVADPYFDGAGPERTGCTRCGQVAELAAEHVDGYPQGGVLESLTNTPTTAHILGGAVIAESRERGVVDRYRRAFGYHNFLITDGSTVPANVGVNPSLTIAAMAEEAMIHLPPKELPA